MPTIRQIRVWHTEVLEISWLREHHGAQELCVERVRVPADGAWTKPAPERPSAQPCGCDVGAGWICLKHRQSDGVEKPQDTSTS